MIVMTIFIPVKGIDHTIRRIDTAIIEVCIAIMLVSIRFISIAGAVLIRDDFLAQIDFLAKGRDYL